MENFASGDNVGLLVTRQLSTATFQHVFITNSIVDRDPLSTATRERAQVFPLFVGGGDSAFFKKVPNLKDEFIDRFSNSIGLSFNVDDSQKTHHQFSPYDVIDYIYSVLHSKKYREKYLEFLKIDFPTIPFPKSVDVFHSLVGYGGKLRRIHLLKDDTCDEFISSFPESGSNIIENNVLKNHWEVYDKDMSAGRVWINDVQFFEGIPTSVWSFYVGNYNPAQKWLNDRVGRKLSFDEIIHYQRIIASLYETVKQWRKLIRLILFEIRLFIDGIIFWNELCWFGRSCGRFNYVWVGCSDG